MFRKVKKAYHIACIAIGKKRVNAILMAVGLVCLYVGYRNNFDIPKTMSDIIQTAGTWKNTAGLPVH